MPKPLNWCTPNPTRLYMLMAFLAALIAIGVFYLLGYRSLLFVTLGAAAMSVGFIVGIGLIRAVLSPGLPVFGIARTVIDEAIRMKVALCFIIGLWLWVPALPFLLDTSELLKYRLQFFLTWSLSGASVMLALMTLFLACATICNEVQNGQIFLTMTKPVSRAQYLLGKWLGIVLLDLLLVAIAGTGIYTLALVLQHQPAQDATDRQAVDKQVLVARIAVPPKPVQPADLSDLYQERLRQLRSQDPALYTGQLDLKTRQAIQHAVMAKWHVIAPLSSESFLFTGLNNAKDFGPSVQLRLKPKSSRPPPDGRVRLTITLNGRPYAAVTLADGHYHVIDLPATAIDPQGQLLVKITNVHPTNPHATFPSSISFTPGQGLQLLYQVDSFAPNLIRALLMIWLRLSFVTILGLTAATFLGFPVACLFGALIYVTAAASGFLAESLQFYATLPAQADGSFFEHSLAVLATIWGHATNGDITQVSRIIIRLLGQLFVMMVPSFSVFNPVPLIADGQLIPPKLLMSMAINIGLLWTGTGAALGWMIFDRRELARVTL